MNMNLEILIRNVQGLNNNDGVAKASNYPIPLINTLNVLCIQEYKLRGSQLNEFGLGSGFNLNSPVVKL